MCDGWGYRQLMGVPERILVSSFYRAEPAYPQVHVVGPMLRDEVRAAKPRDGDYLLAYFNKGEHQYLPQIDRVLRLLDCQVRVYGPRRRGEGDNLRSEVRRDGEEVVRTCISAWARYHKKKNKKKQ